MMEAIKCKVKIFKVGSNGWNEVLPIWEHFIYYIYIYIYVYIYIYMYIYQGRCHAKRICTENIVFACSCFTRILCFTISHQTYLAGSRLNLAARPGAIRAPERAPERATKTSTKTSTKLPTNLPTKLPTKVPRTTLLLVLRPKVFRGILGGRFSERFSGPFSESRGGSRRQSRGGSRRQSRGHSQNHGRFLWAFWC